MLSVSARWAPALTHGFGLSVGVNVLYEGAVIAEDIDFVSGVVKVDAGSDTRRSLTLTIADPTEFPIDVADRYAVYGQRIYVECGLQYLDGSIERVPAGTFVITSVSGNIHTGPLTISAAGLEVLLRREPWDLATSTTGHASPAAFIEAKILAVVPDATFEDRSTGGAGTLSTKTWDAGSDRWSALSEVAASVGAELFADAAGTYVLADIPDPDVVGEAAWDVTAGEAGVMVSADMELSADGVFNRVVVTGENTADNVAPVRAVAAITDPADPLRYGGPFGKVTRPVSSSLATSPAKALAMAQAILRKARSANRRVTLTTVPNPALDAHDRIRVDYGPEHPPEIHLVRSFDIPISVGAGSFAIATISGKDDSA